MGLDDRDYMRERRRRESGAHLGSASWLRAMSVGQDDRKSRYRSTRRLVAHPLQKWIFLLFSACVLIPLYGEAQRKGWLPDFEKAVPFPETGSVTVPENTVGFISRSSLTIVTSEANAVIQLFDPDTNGHALSIYVAANSRVTVPVPSATYRLRLIEGQRWHGTIRYFGPNTSYETVADLMTFEPRRGHVIDLHRRPAGNLRTQLMLGRPEKL